MRPWQGFRSSAVLRAAPRLRPSRKASPVRATRHGRRKRAGISSAAKWTDALSRCARRSPPVSACPLTELACKSSKNSKILTISATRLGSPSRLSAVGAWTSEPSVYAVAAKTARDVVGFAIRRSVGCRTVCSLAVWSELLQRARRVRSRQRWRASIYRYRDAQEMTSSP